MNRSSALFLSLILICQIMANGLNTTPNQSESENFLYVEDIFQSSGNNSSGNNTGCGNNSTYSTVDITINGSVNNSIHYVNQSIPVVIDVSCALQNTSMEVTYGIRSYHNNNLSLSYNYSWYAYTTNHVSYRQFNPVLSTGYYEVWAQLRDSNGAQIDDDNLVIQIINQSNNSGGNNSGGGNNTGGNSTTGDAHCLELSNLSINQTYYVTLNLVNTCSKDIHYPGINASADQPGVHGLPGNMWYMIGGSNSNYSYYSVSSQLTFNQSIQSGDWVELYFEATILHCGQNNSWSHQCPNSNNSSLSIQFQYFAAPARTLSGAIWSPSTNYTTDSSTIDVWYWAHNYTSGSIAVITQSQNSTNGTGHNSTNGTVTYSRQIFHYLPNYADNMSNATTDYNGTIVSFNNRTAVSLSHGWSTICLDLLGDRNSNFTNCIEVYRTPPVVRLSINSATISDTSGRINLAYESENYTGYIQWEYTSSSGSSYSSSYISSSQRSAYLYTDIFGVIVVCGTIDNNVTECVTLSRSARQVTGFIDSPSNNTQFTTNYFQIGFEANNYSNGSILVNGGNVSNLYGQFEDEPYYYYNGTFINRIYNSITVYIPYGLSTVCLELIGEDQMVLTDCITVERIVPPHSVSITYLNTGASIIGQILDLSYTLENSSNHYFTVDGTQTNPIANTSNPAQLNLGFGTKVVCVVSHDFAGTEFSDCVNVTMIDPYADSDSDGVIDTSDLCSNTTQGSSVDSDGCAPYQLDSDSDGVTDDLDICLSTQQFSNVDTNGCAAYQRDSDGDGIMDNLDTCPATPANSVVDAYGCAVSQTDSDSDGVMDDVDLCSGTIVGSQVNSDGCAPSQLDSDSDGVVDSFDQCPGTAPSTVVDQTGCVPTSGGNSSNGSSGGGSSSSGLPSIGIVGTLASIGLGLIVINSRRDD